MEDAVTVQVRHLGGALSTLRAPKAMALRVLKMRLARSCGSPPNAQVLLQGSTVLEDSLTLQELSGETLQLVCRPTSAAAAELIAAVRGGDAARLAALLRAPAHPDAARGDGLTGLLAAAYHGRLAMAQALLAAGAAAEKALRNGATPLHLAAQQGHVAVLRCLLEAKADSNAMAEDKRRPLHIAAQNRHLEVIRCLLQEGALVDTLGPHDMTPAFVCCQRGFEEVLRELLEAKACVDLEDKSGHKLLDMAILEGHLGIAKLLVAFGAQLTSRSGSPLHLASFSNDLQSLQWLLQEGLAVDLLDSKGQTALHVAAHYGHEAVARELFAAQADLEAVAFNGMRPLHLAAFYDQDNVVSFLCQQQVDLNACSRGYSALDLACLRENPLVVRVLCDCGAERQNVFGAVPVSMAHGQHAIVQCMLAMNAEAQP